MFIFSVVVATLQNVGNGTGGNAQRIVNSGAWFLVLILTLWMLLFDQETSTWFMFHDIYRTLKVLMCRHRREESVMEGEV